MLIHNYEKSIITGIDEAGRGCLAGPVVVAAVTWPKQTDIPVADSKTLTEKKREHLFDLILKNAIDYSFVAIDHRVIDTINIRQATLLGMSQAYAKLQNKSELLIIDGIDKPIDLSSAICLPKADSLIPAVSAASIIAKVIRDRMMSDFESIYPGYSFIQHKGYGTKKHREAISLLGPCPIHRVSFKLI